MPYISTQEVAEKRKKLKEAFPNFKFSIRNEHHSSINVSILEAPINMMKAETDGRYVQVNQYYIKDHYENYPEIRDVLLKIYEIINNGNYTENYDSDYGSIPSFYVHISIGHWDKPFKINKLESE